MTNENATPENKETAELDKIGIGEDKPQIGAGTCVIMGYKIEEIPVKKGTANKLILKMKHPKIADRLIDVSGVIYRQGDKLKTAGLWVRLDEDGKIPFNSAVSSMLRFVGKSTISQLEGIEVDTIPSEDTGYLLVKAY